MDETETCWHLLVRTYGGRISILKNLDAPTARQAYQEMMPMTKPVKYINQPKTWEEINSGFQASSGGSITARMPDSFITRVDILGPDGVDLDPWKGVAPTVCDMARERA